MLNTDCLERQHLTCTYLAHDELDAASIRVLPISIAVLQPGDANTSMDAEMQQSLIDKYTVHVPCCGIRELPDSS